MKSKKTIIFSSLYFLIIHTADLWIGKSGIPFITLFLWIFKYGGAIFLLITILRLGYQAIKNKTEVKSYLYSITILSIVVATPFIFPLGILNNETVGGKNILIAHHRGIANSSTIFMLKEENKALIRNTFWGLTDRECEYELRNDTLFLSKTIFKYANSKFAIVDYTHKDNGELIFYGAYNNDSIVAIVSFNISHNELATTKKN